LLYKVKEAREGSNRKREGAYPQCLSCRVNRTKCTRKEKENQSGLLMMIQSARNQKKSVVKSKKQHQNKKKKRRVV
jgi:hypothetical protein